jgi:hypothetical protein
MKKIVLIVLIMGCTTEPEDCAGGAGGSAELDDCGVCDSNAYNDCQDCSTYFDNFQSSQQAFYYFKNVTLNGVNISAEDRVAAFKGEICVGSRQWDTDPENCGGGVCEVPVNGYDGNFPEETAGYMFPGDIPIFKIYDVSNRLIYTATPDIEYQWIETHIFGTDPLMDLVADTTSAAPCSNE